MSKDGLKPQLVLDKNIANGDQSLVSLLTIYSSQKTENLEQLVLTFKFPLERVVGSSPKDKG